MAVQFPVRRPPRLMTLDAVSSPIIAFAAFDVPLIRRPRIESSPFTGRRELVHARYETRRG
jgi:hypothetical protein